MKPETWNEKEKAPDGASGKNEAEYSEIATEIERFYQVLDKVDGRPQGYHQENARLQMEMIQREAMEKGISPTVHGLNKIMELTEQLKDKLTKT